MSAPSMADASGDAARTGPFAEVVPAIERVLAHSLGGAVQIGAVERISEEARRNQLLRCALADAPAGAPATVMVKRRRPDDYHPDDQESWGTVGLFRDWAGLQFLTEVGPEVVRSPRFYGGDRAAGFVVMEDLGTPQSLADLLLKGTAPEAERGLILLATTLGRMHAATIGRETDYRRIRDELGPGDGPERRAKEAGDVRTAGADILNLATRLGVWVPAGAPADVECAAAAVADPGPFLAYAHGDPCPDNNAVILGASDSAGDGADTFRLIDYEISGYRHALRDGVYGRLRFPTCWCVRDLPEPVVERMEQVYRAELVQGCPAAADDTTYLRAVTEVCAAWVLATLGGSLKRALDYDLVWGVATHRQRALLRLAAFADLARRTGHLEALADAAAGLRSTLQARWESATLPIALYPAFTRESEPPRECVKALAEAIETGDEAAARALLREAANPAALANAQGPDSQATPLLTVAVKHNQVALVALLLDYGAEWRLTPRSGAATQHEPALHVAAEEASPEIVRLLLDGGADPNVRDTAGYLPLHVAARKQRTDLVQLLLARGTTIDLLAAIELDRFEEARRLIAQSPDDLAFRFGNGSTLLHRIAEMEDSAARYVPLLIESGLSPNESTWMGFTALHFAARHGHAGLVRALIAGGAKPDAKTRDGATPAELAEQAGHADLAALLREAAPSGSEPPSTMVEA